MAVQEFGECYAERVGTTVDSIIDDLNRAGAEDIKRFLTWWRSLSDADRALAGILASIATAVLLKVLTKAVSQVLGMCILGLLGGASWVLLIKSAVECEPRLDV
ncbi:hypothetical protein [Nonomuraea sediminis]|uniref:hypothetical protein n=1 Tax=Nonomuraea sediminis TaxID=2835864 RepID=UPI001BDD8B38|nr:hypothetical protein [Nonomuraea sediminis]